MIGSDLWSDEDGFDVAIATAGITGICGSGIIEAVAEMRMAGLLDDSGLIGSAAQTGTPRSEPEGRTHSYSYGPGAFNVTVYDPNGVLPQNYTYRYVIIPGGNRHADLSSLTYEELVKRFDIN